MLSKADLLGIIMKVTLYAGLLLALIYFLQDRLLYFPHRTTPDDAADLARLKNLSMWPSDGKEYRGFLSGPGSGDVRGSVVVFHGNAGYALHRDYYVKALGRLGYRVLLYEYPGYGARGGKPSEKTIVEDACLAVRGLRAAYPGPLYLFGESLGAGVAGRVARDCGIEVNGIALITPWDTLPDLAQAIYWFLPARWLVRDRYDNISNLWGYAGPVAVLMAGNDEIVPAKNTRRLYDALTEPKRLWVFEGRGHNNWPIDAGEAWWQEVTGFLQAR